MDSGISGINKNPLDIQPLDIQDTSSTGTEGTNLQIEESLGSIPRDPLTVRTNSEQTVSTLPLSSLQSTNREGVRIDPQRLQVAQNRARAGLPQRIGITVPPSTRAITLDSNMIAKEIQSLPQNQRQQAINNAGKTLQQRVNNGFKVYQQIQNGTATTPATLTDVRDFMTFLTAKANQKTSSFAEGAFNLPDPGNKIRNFLDSSTEVYQRTSTHIEGFTSHTGCGHRGIDLKLPHGMGTLLYGGMKDGVMGTDGDRIFLKMESHGCRISTLSESKVDTEGPGSRPKRFFSDLLSSIKHGFGGLKTLLGLQKTEGTRKERVDKGVEREFKALVQMAEESGVEGLVDLLNANDPAGKRTGRGIRTMMENIKTILERTEGEYDIGDGFVDIELDDEQIINLPEELKTSLESFQERIGNSYDHVEHRIGNEVILSTEELTGTTTKEGMREGQARALVTQLMTIQDGDSVTNEDIKGLLTTMYTLASTTNGDKPQRAQQKENALDKALNGLTTEQKETLKEILNSDKMQDLTNELMDNYYSSGGDLPGYDLSNKQREGVSGLMLESFECLILLSEKVDGEPRRDQEYSESRLGDLSDTIFNLTDSMSEVHSQEEIQEYLSDVEIKDRSALALQGALGEGKMVVGTSAKAMFPNGLPRVNQEEVNAKAKELVEDMLTNPTGEIDTETLWGAFGISEAFMKDFRRSPVIVNGQSFGGHMPDPENKSELSEPEIEKLKNDFFETEVVRFMEAVGGPEKAITVSKLMYQVGDMVSDEVYLNHTGETGQSIVEGQMKVSMQAPEGISTGGIRSITINEDGSATISLTHNKGTLDPVIYSSQVGITLSRLDGDVQVSEVKVAMMFTSND